MKKRHLKKWVKYLLLILFIISNALLFLFIFNNSISLNKEHIVLEKRVKKSNTNTVDNNIEDDLERYVYKDGFYSEKLSFIIKEKITGNSFPVFFSDKYTSIFYDDLIFTIFVWYT